MNIFLDIETVADNRLPQPLLDQLLQVKQDARLKDPEKIADDIAFKKMNVISKMGLSPLTGKVVCFAMTIIPRDDSMQIYHRSMCNVDESIVLDALNKAILETGANYALDQLITFNGKDFDVPFIRTRMALHKMSGSMRKLNEWIKKYSDSHLDLRQFLGGMEAFEKGTMEQWAMLFKVIDAPSNETGADIQSFYDNGEMDRILQKCQRDVEIMVKLYDSAVFS